MDGKKSSGFWVIIAILLGGSYFALPGRSVDAPKPVESASQATPAASPTPDDQSTAEETARRGLAGLLVEEFFCGKNTFDCYDAELARAIRPARPNDRPYSIDTLIAAVPDPIESGLAQEFDEQVDAIQRALETMDLTLDRFASLWQKPSKDQKSTVNVGVELVAPDFGVVPFAQLLSPALGVPDIKTVNSTSIYDDSERDPGTNPGLLLFRDAKNRRLLLVFLVGESPTAGIHIGAFVNAVKQTNFLRKWFPGACKKSALKPIKVLGPAYSGSAQSLLFAINASNSNQPAGNPLFFNIVSGSATSIDSDWFASQGINYHSTLVSDEVTQKRLLDSLKDAPNGIAILAEEGTAYGRALLQDGVLKDDRKPNVLRLEFPLHIAQLEEAAASNPKIVSLNVKPLERPDIPLDSTSQRKDLIPTYSKDQTSADQLALDGLLDTIRREHRDYIIIAGSDVKDEIFLTREVHQVDPTVTAIDLASKVLFLHSEVNFDMRGTLIASTYPLFVENQYWTSARNPGEVAQFLADSAEGTYDAVLALFEDSKHTVESRLPFDSQSDQPPLWLSVVGNGSLWPVAAFKTGDPDLYRSSAGSNGVRAPSSSRVTQWLFGVSVLTLVLFPGLTMYSSINQRQRPEWLVRYLGWSVDPEYSIAQFFYLINFGLVLLFVAVAITLYLYGGSWLRTFPQSRGIAEAATAQMRALRAGFLWNGVSPITPLLFASASILVSVVGAMRRRALMETRPPAINYLSFSSPSFSGVQTLQCEVATASKVSLFWSLPWRVIAVVTILIYLNAVRSWNTLPIDGRLFKWLYICVSGVAFLWIAASIFRMAILWRATRRLLHRLYWHPSRRGYARLRKDMPGGSDSSVDFFSTDTTLTAFEAGLQYAHRLLESNAAKSSGAVLRCLASCRPFLSRCVEIVEQKLNQAFAEAAAGNWSAANESRRAAEEEARWISETVAFVFEPEWRTDNGPSGSFGPKPKDDQEKRLLRVGEAYIATRVCDLLRAVIPHLEVLAISATVAVLLMVLAASSYCFPAIDDLLWFGWFAVAAVVGTTTWLFVSINRDRVISLISGLTPGAIDWNSTFVMQLGVHALIPVMVLLGAAFPQGLSALLGWVGGIFGGGHG